MPTLQLEDVTKVFPKPGGEPVRALSELSLSVQDKECVVIVGPSGSGKTTALRIIAGLEVFTSGTISMDGKVVNGLAPKQRDVAMVFQSPALYPHMSVHQNLGFGLKVRGYRRAEIAERVTKVAEMLGLTACLESRPMELSGGQRQRVALGRAIVRRPSVLLLDEPLANVDPTLRVQMRNEIATLRREFGTTMVYVTHDHLEALLVGDRIAVLHEGKLQQVAAPQILYNRPANVFVASFIGSPPMNLIPGALARQSGELFFVASTPGNALTRDSSKPLSLKLQTAVPAAITADGKRKILLGLRPEHINLVSNEAGRPLNLSIRAEVLSIQGVGPDMFVSASSGGVSFVARVPGDLARALNQPAEFTFRIECACWFDAGSGKEIC